ncbi:V-type ATP synthase subunit I [Acholeplasma oculi]|uniref:V-type ATP synthase subunit I n=1 Tax=Acholeplasma oculi TaxID=35623 RepID=A0A061AG77_9MOLU|nr:V-type ATP synthase subunit I [Acholeplasma oculi]CDR30571.1 V-type ATP synthase subunit I [Acholeplasma oculi]SKC46879.1 V/A-type H+-transporting ATPase subunit I [Acholeplasma oculi]SUT89260.1 V-type ATP synthase subunit I [Acholeplasma oculi]
MIVSMKKAKLIFMEEDFNKIIKTIQVHGFLMLDQKYLKTQSPSEDTIKVSKAIEILDGYLKKSIGGNEVVELERFENLSNNTLLVANEIIEKQNQLTKHKEGFQKFKKKLETVLPYRLLPVEQAKLKNLKFTDVLLGKVKEERLLSLKGFLEGIDAYVDIISKDEFYTYINVVFDKEYYEQAKDILNQHQFIEHEIEKFSQKNPLMIEYYQNEMTKYQDAIVDIENFMIEHTKQLAELKLLYDQQVSKDLRKQINLGKTNQTVYIEGWMRGDQVADLEKVLKDESLTYELETRDANENENVPTALKNNRLIKPFEYITNQFSIPSPKEIDPNPMMSFWYWIIFGIMMGDIGYGLSMILIFGLAAKFGKLRGGIKDLATIFFYSGFTAILAGLVFGSFFGATLYTPLLDPIQDPVPMLIISIAIGIIHIICALIMKMINTAKQGDILTGIADGLSWILILLGISIYAATMFIQLDAMLMNILTYIALGSIGIGVLIIIVLSGRHTKSIFGKIMSAFGGLYSSTSYLSDVLSYSRILALALSSAVIAFTMNLLADMVWNSIPFVGFLLGIVVYLVGHIFNFVMGLLSAYVHAGRLQYLEYYGKFYEGGGYLFEPLQLQLKYVYQVNLKEKK